MRTYPLAILGLTLAVPGVALGDPTLHQENPGASAHLVEAVWGSASEMYTCGDGGELARSTDHGATWVVLPSGTTADLKSVWGDGAGVVYVVGTKATFLRSSDHGATFTALPASAAFAGLDPNANTDLDGVWASGSVVVAVGINGALRSEDGGKTFTRPSVRTTDVMTSVWGSGSTIIAVGQSGTIRRSTDSGKSWSLPSGKGDDELDVVWGLDLGHIYAAGRNGTLLISNDGGATWKQIGSPDPDQPQTSDVKAIWGLSASDLFAGGELPCVYHSTDAGLTWTKLVDFGSLDDGKVYPQGIQGMWGTGASDLYAVGGGQPNGIIARSTDDGLTWVAQDQAPGFNLRSVVDVGGDAWAAGEDGLVHVHAGHASLAVLPTAGQYNGVWGVGSDVWGVGRQGVVVHSSDGGATFTQQAGGEISDPERTAIWGSSANDLYMAGEQSILRSTDKGATWTDVTPKLPADSDGSSPDVNVTQFWGTGPGDVWAVGWHGLIVHTTDHGATWSAVDCGCDGMSLSGIAGTAAGEIFAVGGGGLILHSTDKGKSFVKVKNNRIPIVTAFNGVAVAGATVVIGGDCGILLVSTNDGGSFTNVGPGNPADYNNTSVKLAAAAGGGPSDLYVVGDGGTVYHLR